MGEGTAGSDFEGENNMIIYRPACGGLAEAMAQAKEFESEQEMKEYIVKKYADVHDQAPFGI